MVAEHPGGAGADEIHRGERAGDDLGERRRGPVGQQPGEVEGLVHLVGAHEAGQGLRRLGPGLGDQDPVAVVLGQDVVPAAVDVVDLGLVPHRLVAHRPLDHARALADGTQGDAPGGGRDGVADGMLLVLGHDLVAQARLLEQAVGDVDPESVDSAVEPEAQDVLEHVADLAVAPVEVGLGGVEEVEVPLTGGAVRLGDARPGRPTEDGLPVVRRLDAVGAATVAEEVARPLRAARLRGERSLEPRVLARGVVGHQVDDHLEVELVGASRAGCRRRSSEPNSGSTSR